MSIAEPLALTVSTGAVTLPRVSPDGKEDGVFRSADGRVELIVDHQDGKRVRRVVRLNTSKIAPDQFRDDQNVELSMSVYIVFDLPDAGIGYTNAEALANAKGLIALCTASSDLVLTKVLGGES